MNSRWNHFNAFELFPNLPTTVVNTKLTASWEVQKYKYGTLSKQPLCMLLRNVNS